MERAILRTCEPPHRDPSGRFIVGNSGRPRGPNRVHRTLREAIVLAAAEHGFDGRGSGDLPGFLRMVIERDLKTFCGLLARCIPIDVHSKAEEPERTFRTIEEVQAELEARGIDADYLAHMAESMARRAKANGSGGSPELASCSGRPLEAGRRDVRGGSVYQRAKLILSGPTSICRSVLVEQRIARGGPRRLRIPARVPPRSDHPIITEARDSRHTAVGGLAPRPAPATGSGLCQCQALGKVPQCPRSSRIHRIRLSRPATERRWHRGRTPCRARGPAPA